MKDVQRTSPCGRVEPQSPTVEEKYSSVHTTDEDMF